MLKRVWVVGVPVTDWERSVRFYRDTLGLKIQLDARKFRWMEFGQDEPMCKIGLALVDPKKDRDAANRDSGVAFEVDDAEKFFEKMAAKGVEFVLKPTKTPWGGVVANFVDPDGNIFQAVQHDPREHYAADSPLDGEPSLRRR